MRQVCSLGNLWHTGSVDRGAKDRGEGEGWARARWLPWGCCLAADVGGRGKRERKIGWAGVVIYSSAPRASIVGPGSPDSGTVHSLRLASLNEPRYARERFRYFHTRGTLLPGVVLIVRGESEIERSRGVRRCRRRRCSHFSSFASDYVKLDHAIKRGLKRKGGRGREDS